MLITRQHNLPGAVAIFATAEGYYVFDGFGNIADARLRRNIIFALSLCGVDSGESVMANFIFDADQNLRTGDEAYEWCDETGYPNLHLYFQQTLV